MIDPATTLEVLREGDIEIVGRILGSSNHAMLCRVRRPCPPPEEPLIIDAVYKPTAGERPLDDFPDETLSHREVAAYLVSEAMGWAIVPPTIRRDGPFGDGSLQLWIDIDPTVDVVAMVVEDDPRLRRIAVFDAAVNNTDRKGGHLLPTSDGHIFGVDHGVCFSTDDKLRTLLWQWRGRPLGDEAIDVLSGLRAQLEGELGESLRDLLAPDEVATTILRVDRLLSSGRHPQPSDEWPPVPWPPF